MKNKTLVRSVSAFYIFAILCNIVLWSAVVAVVWHFVSKYW